MNDGVENCPNNCELQYITKAMDQFIWHSVVHGHSSYPRLNLVQAWISNYTQFKI